MFVGLNVIRFVGIQILIGPRQITFHYISLRPWWSLSVWVGSHFSSVTASGTVRWVTTDDNVPCGLYWHKLLLSYSVLCNHIPVRTCFVLGSSSPDAVTSVFPLGPLPLRQSSSNPFLLHNNIHTYYSSYVLFSHCACLSLEFSLLLYNLLNWDTHYSLYIGDELQRFLALDLN